MKDKGSLFRLLWFSIVTFVFAFCSSDKLPSGRGLKEVSIGAIKLRVPGTYKYVEVGGVDSYVAYLINEHSDTFHVEYGKRGIIYNLFNLSPKAFPKESKVALEKHVRELSPDIARFSKYPDEDNEMDVFQPNFYLADTINGIEVRIVQPKKIGQGITGLYIPELKDKNSFSIYADNLDSIHHQEAIRFFRSVNYRNALLTNR